MICKATISTDTQTCTFTLSDATFKDFYPLSKIPNSQIEGHGVVVKVNVSSDYGDIHILFSESDDNTNANQGFEFALTPWEGSELRRRDKAYGKYEVIATSNYNVTEYAPNVTYIEISISTGHNTLFIQARCETVYGWHDEDFHPLTTVASSQPDGYYAKVDISMLSDYGDIHIFLSENDTRTGHNPCYEFVIGDRFKIQSEIRQKESILEENNFVGSTVLTDYNMKVRRSSLRMQISVSKDGTVSFTDLQKKLQFNYTNTENVIPVKFITFGGYRMYPATYQINCRDLDVDTKC